ncbi:acetylxylan esterase [Kiritimatiellaeota bacterium B1221]|nr:acetylxylan esterase [Kiritimatiellaeota bacterium B1221]
MKFESTPHDFDFDPTYGHTVTDLQAIDYVDEAPADFAEFWQGLHAKAMAVPLELEVEEDLPLEGGFRCQLVRYRVWPDYRVGAWVIFHEEHPRPDFGVVMGHGYGGREAPEVSFARKDRIVIFTVAPGFHISQDDRLPLNDAGKHVVYGIESRERYLLAACAATIWRGVDVLTELTQGSVKRFHYHGWSFGGGMGALSVPWESRFESAELGHVTFANHPFRLRNECVGSGAAVRERWLKDPSIEETLVYYDAAFSVRHLKIPTLFGCSCFDPAVPPPGQWSAANSHPGPSRATAFPVGHFAYAHPQSAEAEQTHAQNLKALMPWVLRES